MAFPGPYTGRRYYSRLVVFVLCFQAAFLGAQTVAVDVSPGTLRAGDSFRVTITLDELLGPETEIEEPEYPDIIEKTRGPVVESLVRGPFAAREDVTQVIAFDFRCLDPGFAVLPAFEIRDEEEVMTTEPVLMAIGVAEGDWWVPPTLTWSIAADDLVVGQTTLVSLNLTRSADFEFPDRIEVESPASAVFEEVTGIGSVSEIDLFGQRLLSYPVATYLATPTAEGFLEVPSAITEIRGVRQSTEPLRVPVRPIPEAAAAGGAVGQFHFAAEVSPARVTVGEGITVSMRVTGEGNLSYFAFPEIDAPGFVQSDQTEVVDAVPTPRGYRGSRRIDIRLQALEITETSSVRVGTFVYYDPVARIVRSVSPGRFPVDVVEVDNAVPSPEAFPFRPLTETERAEVAPANHYLNPWFYLLLLPPVLLSILLPALRTSGIIALLLLASLPQAMDAQVDAGVASTPLELYETGNLREAYDALRPEARSGGDPGTRYNFALMAFQLGQEGEAIYHLREAIRLQPSFSIARDALAYMENAAGLENQVVPPQRIHPDRFLIIFIVLSYVLGALAVLPLRYRSGIHSVGMVLMVIALLVTLGGMGLSILHLREPSVVVGVTEGELRRIPQDIADPWVLLPEGTALIARDRHEKYFLVETGSEITGWIHSDQILINIGDGQ